MAGRVGDEARRVQRAHLGDGYAVKPREFEGIPSGPKYDFLRGLGVDVGRVRWWGVTVKKDKTRTSIAAVHTDAVGGVLFVNELQKEADTNVGGARRFASEMLWRAYAGDAAACSRPISGMRMVWIDTIINPSTQGRGLEDQGLRAGRFFRQVSGRGPG